MKPTDSTIEPLAASDISEEGCLSLARKMALVAGGFGLAGLVGWLFNLTALMSVWPGFVAMKPNTALCLCFGGPSLFLLVAREPNVRRRQVSALLAGVMLLIGAVTLAEYLSNTSFGLDELLFKDRFVSAAPGRMAPISAFNFVLLGLALLLLQSSRRIALAHVLSIGAALTSVLSVVGYIYGVKALYESGRFTAVALHTSVAFLLLCGGIFCASSRAGFMRLATNPDTSGLLIRRYVPAALVLPFLIGWVRVQAVRYGWCSQELGVVLVALANAMAFIAVIWIGAKSLRTAERRQTVARGNLRESEERLNLVVKHLTEGLVIWDRTGDSVNWNPAALAMYGFASGEAGPKGLADFVQIFEMSALDGQVLPPEEWPLRRLISGQPVKQMEVRVRRRDQGWEKIYRYGGSLVQGHGGRELGFLTISDITAQREAQGLFQEVANAMPQMVWTARPDGFIDYYNERWYEYTGGKRGDYGDTSWQHINHPEDFPVVHREFYESVTTGKPFELEFRLRNAADGQFRWFLTRAVAIKDTEGRVRRWIGTNTDIHESKLLQDQHEQLLVSERAARAESDRTGRMKDEFLATLSHELRTPLNAMLGWTQVLRGDPANSVEVEEGLAIIERNARAQKGIIDDLLDMSGIISGKVRLNVQAIDLAAVVTAAVETVRPAAEAKGIRLQPIIDPQARHLYGDANRLQQVFWNLLSNAIKFTPKEGRVQVALQRIHSHLEVTVSDSGEGISQEFLPHVFDRFRQADGSITRRHGGLGLGLAIVKQLVELHGGSVHVDSAGPGQGTTFRVLLPLAAVQPGDDDSSEEERRHPQSGGHPSSVPTDTLNLAGIKVLVVDDEADARALGKRLLEDRGAIVRGADSAESALAEIRQERPDVLVSDIGMPEQDGYALIRQVRALPPGQGGNLPALALTAYARPEDRMKAVLAGFQTHLAKPVEAPELLVLVAGLAGRLREGIA